MNVRVIVEFRVSFIESFIDVTSGLILAILIQLFIFPFFNLNPNIIESFQIAFCRNFKASDQPESKPQQIVYSVAS